MFKTVYQRRRIEGVFQLSAHVHCTMYIWHYKLYNLRVRTVKNLKFTCDLAALFKKDLDDPLFMYLKLTVNCTTILKLNECTTLIEFRFSSYQKDLSHILALTRAPRATTVSICPPGLTWIIFHLGKNLLLNQQPVPKSRYWMFKLTKLNWF